jgi:hypothetical protein
VRKAVKALWNVTEGFGGSLRCFRPAARPWTILAADFGHTESRIKARLESARETVPANGGGVSKSLRGGNYVDEDQKGNEQKIDFVVDAFNGNRSTAIPFTRVRPRSNHGTFEQE